MAEARAAETRGAETRKVLEMLYAQQVTVDQAMDLLSALGPDHGGTVKAQGAAKTLRLVVDAEDEAKVRVNVPTPLAKFALQFVPKDVRDELESQGINLAELLDALKGDLPEGRLVDIEGGDDKPIRVIIEVA